MLPAMAVPLQLHSAADACSTCGSLCWRPCRHPLPLSPCCCSGPDRQQPAAGSVKCSIQWEVHTKWGGRHAADQRFWLPLPGSKDANRWVRKLRAKAGCERVPSPQTLCLFSGCCGTKLCKCQLPAAAGARLVSTSAVCCVLLSHLCRRSGAQQRRRQDRSHHQQHRPRKDAQSRHRQQ